MNADRILSTTLCIFQVTGWALAGETAPAPHTFSIGDNDFLLDGQRFQIRCGEIHAPRVPREYWRDIFNCDRIMSAV